MSPNPAIAYESVYTSEEGLGKTRAAEQRFLGEHLLVWTPDFCRNLHERARCGLYRGLASSLSQFLALEREDFNL